MSKGVAESQVQNQTKELKKQGTEEELPEDEVPPPPRTVVLLLEAYPEKMIEIREQIVREQEEREAAEEAKESEEQKRNQSRLAESQAHNKSTQENKSQTQEDSKKKRKDSTDVKHLENNPLHLCYTQNKNLLNIDASHSIAEIDAMVHDTDHGAHISFWVFFESIKYDHPKNHITFLSFGKNATNPTLVFSLEKVERKEKDRRGKEVNVVRNNLIVKYVGLESNKVGRIVAESFILPNKLYFVTLSTVWPNHQYSEIKLTVNGKIEGCQSANEGIAINSGLVSVGSEVTSSMFKGLLSDLMILCIPFDLEEQKRFYENYWDYPNGQRAKELVDDQLILAKINEKYTISGCPKDLLRSYKYDENYKRSIQERRHFKEHVETEAEIKAKTDKSKAAKLERERIQRRIKADVNTFIEDIRNGFPHYFDCLQSYVSSRKWIFKSWNLYSPTIKKPSEPVLPFPCVHNELSKLQDLQCPFYGIEEEYFFRVLNMLSEVNTEFKRILAKFAEITETIYKDKKFGIYIAYDRWLHYLCWADQLKPYGWVEKVEEDEEEEEVEDMSSSEEDPNEQENKNPQSDVPQTEFIGNIFVGDKDNLKEKLKGFMHELNETAEEETGDIPKMYYENRKLHSFEVAHDTERIQGVTFNYIVRTDEKTPWEEVMKEYEIHAAEHNADEPVKDDKKDAKKDEKKSKNQPASTLYKIEQVKCFQEKLPEEDTGKKGQDEKKDEKEDPNAKKRYKFPDPKLMSKDVFKILDAEKIEFKSCDNKIYSIRGFYKDGRAHRLEFPKRMSPQFQAKREKRLQDIEDAKKAQERQEEEIKAKEKEKKEREQKERRERRENKKNKEEFVKGPEVEETPDVPPPKIDIPELGEYGKVMRDWIPGHETKFAMALVSEDNDLIGLGLYENHHQAIRIHNPESLDKIPIKNFKDVLTHICKKQIDREDHFRVRHLKFKFTTEKFLEIGATVERKGKTEDKWYTDVQEEKARVKREAEQEEEKKRKEEDDKKARQPGNEDQKAPEKKVEKKKEEERSPEEIEKEQAHLFYIDFVHEDIARQRRIEEIATRKAAKDKTKGDDKGKSKPPVKDAGKDGKKDGKKDDKKGKNDVEEKKENIIHTMDIDLKKIMKVRIDHKYGQVYKILFHYDDESVTVLEIPALGEEQGKAFMAMVDVEIKKKDAQEKKKLDDYNREHRKHERAEKRKRIQARKNGEVYVPTEFTKQKPQPKVESDEEKRIINQSIYYVNQYKQIDGLWSIFNPELKNFKFWGVEFKVKKTEEEVKKEKEAQEKKKAEEAQKLANPEAAEEAKKEAEDAKKMTDKHDPYKLKDDFIRNYSLSRLGLKLIFFIDYYVTPERKEKSTVTVSSQKFKDELFKENYDIVTKFIHEILPDSTVIPNFRKLGAIGLFKVYTYGLGENPEQEKEFFSNKQIKTAFPDIKKLYYDLIDEFVHYDDLKKLEVRQREELMNQGIPLPNDKKTMATLPLA